MQARFACEGNANWWQTLLGSVSDEQVGMRLQIDYSSRTEPVYVDREMWEKIVLNLLSNAFKFTLESEIAASLQWETGGNFEHQVPKLTILPQQSRRSHGEWGMGKALVALIHHVGGSRGNI
ncbi:MAG: hypothetical protein HC840_27850 [Leptolyngbyaceae cyanobacterium RM2_2_4]|nr:hypothetical protein [Leptolyngbyaceae cyanobacterium SL_5_14]NJO52583.1 hypothetical protein [Leptolyngbyaceae cyanobacterium RM2_2_4]